jgi:hypothetical protein
MPKPRPFATDGHDANGVRQVLQRDLAVGLISNGIVTPSIMDRVAASRSDTRHVPRIPMLVAG